MEESLAQADGMDARHHFSLNIERERELAARNADSQPYRGCCFTLKKRLRLDNLKTFEKRIKVSKIFIDKFRKMTCLEWIWFLFLILTPLTYGLTTGQLLETSPARVRIFKSFKNIFH